MRFVFKKLFLFFIFFFFSVTVFCDITLTNCSKHRLKVSFFEHVGSGRGYCKEVIRPGAICLIPNNTKFTIYYKKHKFKFDENIFKPGVRNYKILFNVKRRYRINEETGERQISRISMVCRIVYEEITLCEDVISKEYILCASDSYHSIKFQRPARN